MTRYPVLIGGEEVYGQATFVDLDPATGRELAEVARGGPAEIDAAVAAARGGDPIAQGLVELAATGIADVFLRLAVTFDPENMVLGGGFAGSFDLFDHQIKQAMSVLPDPPIVTPSVIASEAVLLGGLIAANPFVETWLADRVRAI